MMGGYCLQASSEQRHHLQHPLSKVTCGSVSSSLRSLPGAAEGSVAALQGTRAAALGRRDNRKVSLQ